MVGHDCQCALAKFCSRALHPRQKSRLILHKNCPRKVGHFWFWKSTHVHGVSSFIISRRKSIWARYFLLSAAAKMRQPHKAHKSLLILPLCSGGGMLSSQIFTQFKLTIMSRQNSPSIWTVFSSTVNAQKCIVLHSLSGLQGQHF